MHYNMINYVQSAQRRHVSIAEISIEKTFNQLQVECIYMQAMNGKDENSLRK